MIRLNNMSKKTDTHSDISQIGNVDQIREILFGSQTRELNQRFDMIEKEIHSLKDEVYAKIQQNHNDFNAYVEGEFEAISKKIKSISSQQQMEFNDIRDISTKQEKRLQSSIDIVEEELNAKREQLQKSQLENRDMLRLEMKTLKDELLKALGERTTQLQDEKLSKDDAADIMMEVAIKMKGTQLEQITQIDGKK
jgi:hypothetical protein